MKKKNKKLSKMIKKAEKRVVKKLSKKQKAANAKLERSDVSPIDVTLIDTMEEAS